MEDLGVGGDGGLISASAVSHRGGDGGGGAGVTDLI